MFLKRLECSACGREHEWSRLQNLCDFCNKPLFAIVDLAAASRTLTRETLLAREKSLWRYREVLPLPSDVEPASLGEGGTPLPTCTQASPVMSIFGSKTSRSIRRRASRRGE